MPYASNTKEVKSDPDAGEEDAVCVVRNKEGKVVFAVYQACVRVFVHDRDGKRQKGGFAVGGLSGGKADRGHEVHYSVEYATVVPVLVDAIKEQQQAIDNQQQIGELKAQVEQRLKAMK